MAAALSGTEILFVTPLHSDGTPGPILLKTTTGAIAALAGEIDLDAAQVTPTGSTTRTLANALAGPFDLTASGTSGQYDAQISVSGGGSDQGQGVLAYTAALHDFQTFEGSSQFQIGTQPNAVEWWTVIGAQSGLGPTMMTSSTTNGNVNGRILAQGTGLITLGNGYGPFVAMADPGGPIVNALQIAPALSNSPVTLQVFGVGGGDGLPSGLNLNAHFNGTVGVGNSNGVMLAVADPNAAQTTHTDFLTVNPSTSTAAPNIHVSGSSASQGFQLQAKGNGSMVLANGNGPLLAVKDGNGTGVPAIGYFVFTTGVSPSGSSATLSVGGQTNNSIKVESAGNGNVSLSANGTGGVVVGIASDKIGFMGATAAAKPAITGSRGGNVALASLLTALATLGLLTDSSTT